MKTLVFTEQSITTFAENLTQEKIIRNDLSDKSKYITIEQNNIEFFFTTNKKDESIEKIPFIIISKILDFAEFQEENIRSLLFEIHKITVQILQHKSFSFSSPSIIYKKDNFIVLNIFNNYHLFLSIKNTDNNIKNILAFKITNNKKEKIETAKDEYDICLKDYESIELCREQLKQQYNQAIENLQLSEMDYSYNFSTVFDDEDQSRYTFEDWKNKLSPKQKMFFDNDKKNALKLLGPAGTGKTLVMQLKAIQLVKNNKNVRILYTCHSWSVACQVSDFIDIVAPDVNKNIDIYPLLELAKEKVVLRDKDIIFLGDDSYKGKIEQIKILNMLIKEFIKSDWIMYKKDCSKDFCEKLESINLENNNFTWEIMIEIACVIGANGIMPGKASFDKYDKISRRNWMMYLENSNEKKVIFQIYTSYMNYLVKNNSISSDQIINDYINFLTTYNWYYERKTYGYDYIFVDEMQLFNDQERLSLTYLSRYVDEYPKIIMALDPKQSMEKIYSDIGISEILSKLNPETDASIGKTNAFTLDIAYRYTKEILTLLKHIDSSYPQMDLAEKWDNGMKNLKHNKIKNGECPILYTYKNDETEVKEALSLAKEYSQKGKQTIVLSLQDNLFTNLQKSTTDINKYHQILSKKDIGLLKYTKKKIFISKPTYVIGLQFDVVILIGCYTLFSKHDPHQSHNRITFLSDLYLGASRAKNILILTNNITMPEFPDFLQKAIDVKCLKYSKIENI
ncbi:UvrD-helicase domain-containing protein [Treponema vincentii]|uniref:UvrD-helicase domain-containing protein n=1 Tax=Treponema vincentii TaxID=69710 RepID=UPI0020A56E22|nr:UvrD-helicase domain-containing protein [Treponema vincentii]UTC49293.1 UvrD-helicase domain-containing protein [Treponema vincentii]